MNRMSHFHKNKIRNIHYIVYASDSYRIKTLLKPFGTFFYSYVFYYFWSISFWNSFICYLYMYKIFSFFKVLFMHFCLRQMQLFIIVYRQFSCYSYMWQTVRSVRRYFQFEYGIIKTEIIFYFYSCLCIFRKNHYSVMIIT